MLNGKIAAITGAARGIGLATSLEFARAGATVVLLGRDLASIHSACETIRAEVPDAQLDAIACDVSEPKSVRDAFQAIFKNHKRLHVLVSNAGVLDDALIDMVSREQIERTFGVNTFGVLYCSQYASRLIARSGGGSIINISSIIGSNGNVGQAVYGGSKAAVIGITKSLAKELAPRAIRVNAIAPGFIETDMARSIGPAKYQERLDSIKMGRAGQASDIANVALFLASDLSSYVTGQLIGVDGGMLI
jgi:3-oxoacyl-[acyl-carrier protein] reductase